MTNEALEAEILDIARKEIHPSIEPDTRLVDEGLLDSFLALKLVSVLEEQYSIRLEVTEISADDIADVRAIAALTARSRG